MPIPESTLSGWSHHQASTAFKQAHLPIREALDAYKGLSKSKYEVFLQGSCKNDTNLGGDSNVGVVVGLAFGRDCPLFLNVRRGEIHIALSNDG